ATPPEQDLRLPLRRRVLVPAGQAQEMLAVEQQPVLAARAVRPPVPQLGRLDAGYRLLGRRHRRPALLDALPFRLRRPASAASRDARPCSVATKVRADAHGWSR